MEPVCLVGVVVAIDGVVYYGKKRVGVNTIVLTRLVHCLVAEAKCYAEATERLQHIVVVAYERYHLVVRLVNLMILHCLTL